MYDPVVGRFTSADTAQSTLGDPSGMDGYAYVGGRVESATDPSGHLEALLDNGTLGGPGNLSAGDTIDEGQTGLEGNPADYANAADTYVGGLSVVNDGTVTTYVPDATGNGISVETTSTTPGNWASSSTDYLPGMAGYAAQIASYVALANSPTDAFDSPGHQRRGAGRHDPTAPTTPDPTPPTTATPTTTGHTAGASGGGASGGGRPPLGRVTRRR
jgi:hypothetical protein